MYAVDSFRSNRVFLDSDRKTEQLAKLREKAANRKQKEKIATERKHKRLPQHS
jgi:hypothetical protein